MSEHHDPAPRTPPTIGSSETFWEQHYATVDTEWGTRPNAVLVAEVTRLADAPGRALDLGAGHGGDALWLAGRGWHVTAVDVSATALSRVSDAAGRAGLSGRIVAERHDLTVSLPAGTFDLVTACYFHTPVEVDRVAVLRGAAQHVAAGGILLVVDHASLAPWSWRGDGGHADFPTAAESLTALDLAPDDWRTERCASPERTASGPDGQTATVTENVIVMRRLR